MKKLLFITAFIVSASIMTNVSAQVRFSASVNIGMPGWIPAGYTSAPYYYLPEIDAYYNLPLRQFVYFNGYDWIYAATLPSIYAGFNLYKAQRFPIYEPSPYLHANMYREKYAAYSNLNHQPFYHQAYASENRYREYRDRDGYGRREELHGYQHLGRERRF